jgi:hypothetical protein
MKVHNYLNEYNECHRHEKLQEQEPSQKHGHENKSQEMQA